VAIDTNTLAVDTAVAVVDTTAEAIVYSDTSPTFIDSDNKALTDSYFIGKWRIENAIFYLHTNGWG